MLNSTIRQVNQRREIGRLAGRRDRRWKSARAAVPDHASPKHPSAAEL